MIDGLQTVLREIEVNGANYEGLIWYWYEVDGNVATTSLATKAYQVLALLLGRPAGGRVIVIESRVEGDIQSTRDRLERVAVAILEQGASAGTVGNL
jgi:EpsI family protein